MKEISKSVLAGMSVLLPVMLSIQLLVWMVATVERWLRGVLLLVAPESIYFPGMATLGFLLVAAVIGYSTRLNLVSRFWAIPGRLIERLPLVNYLYATIQDFLDILRGKSFEDQAVVGIDLPGMEGKVFGILTRKGGKRSSRDDEPGSGNEADSGRSALTQMMADDEVAVYLPMSYQAGGYMLIVPEDRVTRLNVSPGDALRVILSAGIGQKN